MSAPASALAAVLQKVSSETETAEFMSKQKPIRGYDLNSPGAVDYRGILDSFSTTGIQAQCLSQAIEVVDAMLEWSLADEPVAEDEDEEYLSVAAREQVRCKVFVAYTSNMVTAGTREYLRYLCQHKLVNVLVTSAGGVEEDFIKCLAPTVTGDFDYSGLNLRRSGLNRVGNMIIPNDNYCAFEDFFSTVLDGLMAAGEGGGCSAEKPLRLTPSMLIREMGRMIDNEDSIYYWCYKNDIPVFCPAITDGSLGDMLYFHSYKHTDCVIVDLVQDIRRLNDEALRARRTGCIILGGGTPKHHVLNANLMRNGTDYLVYVNSGSHADASDSGASPDEAVSWGKVKVWAKPVKVYAEATLVFPWLVARCFAERVKAESASFVHKRKTAILNKQMTPTEREAERLATMGK